MPAQQFIPVNGVQIAVFEWGERRADQPSILFVHATGFHARIWDQVIALLPGYHCCALDLRGHGRSSKPAPPYHWRLFGEDVAAVAQALGLTGAVGVGHSIGGHAITLAAALQPALFARLLLIDPVIMVRENYIGITDYDHFTARRRSEWASPDEMVARFKDRPPFNAWKPEVLRDYAEYGLLPNPSGMGYILACAPEFEAATYNYSTAANIYPEIATVQIPVTILRSGRAMTPGVLDLNASPTAPDLAAQFPHAVDIVLADNSHFIPMEAPELVADTVREMAESH